MPEQFLYQALDAVSNMGYLKKEIPDSLRLNLHPRYELREYQIEAFARFIHCYKNDYPNKAFPLHFLFNMATGSGKTLIMAGLILYLYEQGYRNFLFFVNSTNIIEKTKDNFLNPSSIKYLFNPIITIDNHRVQVNPVPNFEGVNPHAINICFTTIQKLHSDLTTQKENSLTFEDFRKHKIVLISDESHHMNVQTRAEMELFESWENTVQNIFEQNRDNLLLEFTATHDFATPAMVNKYRDKVIIRYDLPEFRNDGFSKEITLVYSDFSLDDRILQALILSQYKQEVAASQRVNLKPVILFKAQRTIAQSQDNKENFHRIIDNLTGTKINRIRKSNIPIVQRAFRFFTQNGIGDNELAKRLRSEFRKEFTLSVNDESEKETYQIIVNTLEDKDNRIRAIFAVQKLNEGWDVLNLFDIVRCYEVRDSGKNKIGTTTMSEAQLIGRGARYFPFVLPQNTDRFRRKFDRDVENELRVIEELHYHSINDSRYIAEIRQALHEQGLMDKDEVTKQLRLKESFKKTPLYKYGLIYTNRPIQKDYKNVFSFADLGVTKNNFVHIIATGKGGESAVLNGKQQVVVINDENRRDVALKDIDRNIIQTAIARNPFYTFSSLKRYFPNLNSIDDFIVSDYYLGGLEITFSGDVYLLDENRREQLDAVLGLLNEIETQIRENNKNEFEGSREFTQSFIHQIFKDKTLKFSKDNLQAQDDPELDHFITSRDYLTFDRLYATSEEKNFIFLLDREINKLKTQYEEVYLMRNEGHFSIYDFTTAQAFQPDFVLYMNKKNGKSVTYQIFIEPKGAYLAEHDRWKEDFLKEIKQECKGNLLTFEDGTEYRLIGIPFYSSNDENAFRDALNSALPV